MGEMKASKEKDMDSLSSGSDLRDVLNCIRNPRDVRDVHKRVRIESTITEKDAYFEKESEGDSDKTLAELQRPLLRIPIYPVPKTSSVGDAVLSRSLRWCYCEEDGSTRQIDKRKNVGFSHWDELKFLKYAEPKLAEKEPDEDDRPTRDFINLRTTLNTMFPPKYFRSHGQLWKQEVSSEPTKRAAIASLVNWMDITQKEIQTKEFSPDLVRRHMIDCLFDELIRQESIVNVETALLLFRVRNELRMTIAVWESILAHANNFGMQQIAIVESVLAPLKTELAVQLADIYQVEDELRRFHMMEELAKVEERRLKEFAVFQRQDDLAPFLARNKVLREQIKQLGTRDDESLGK